MERTITKSFNIETIKDVETFATFFKKLLNKYGKKAITISIHTTVNLELDFDLEDVHDLIHGDEFDEK
jgi:hypothetical protein